MDSLQLFVVDVSNWLTRQVVTGVTVICKMAVIWLMGRLAVEQCRARNTELLVYGVVSLRVVFLTR